MSISSSLAAQAADIAVPSLTPLQNEARIVAAGHAAARADKESEVDAQLASPALGAVAELPASIVLARRAMAVCACLQNENNRARATKLARRVVARLASMTESSDADRAERLIWEATLDAQFLDDKKQALALLQIAGELAPDDPRIPGMKAGLTAALEAFGR